MAVERVLALAFIVIILMGGVGVVQTGYEDSVTGSQPHQAIENETITAQAGTNTLNESNRDVVYNESVTVRNSSDGSTISESEYDWQSHNGTLFVPSGSTIEGETVDVTYGLTEPANEQQAVRDVSLFPSSQGDTLTLIGGIAFLLAAIAVFAKMGGA